MRWRPKHRPGEVPLGRIAIAVQIAGALLFLGYTLAKKDISLPFSADRYEVEVIFPDAKGLDPADGPSAAVAGSPLGKVTKVRYEDGRAVATLDLDSDVKGKIFADATARLRPASALQNLLVNIDPGTPAAGPLPDGQAIQPQNTETFVAIDDLTSVFDADTQAYAQILLGEADRAVHGRAGSLRSSLAELGRLTDTAQPVAAALADRRLLLTRLVGDLDTIFSTVSTRGEQLGRAVDAGSRTLEVTSARRHELEQLTTRLAPLTNELNRSLAATRRVTEPLAPVLSRLAPASRRLPMATAQLRRLIPVANRFLTPAGRLLSEGQLPLRLLLTGTDGLTQKVEDLLPQAKDLAVRADILDKYKGGVAQLADTFSGVFSVTDGGGVFGQVDVLGIEPLRPENFGFPPSTKASSPKGQEMYRLFATALEQRCAEGSVPACIMRVETPGLPTHQVMAPGGDGR
jgi:phospholipid/cholesterol/gamma-HCH transport system substrate-binding protein